MVQLEEPNPVSQEMSRVTCQFLRNISNDTCDIKVGEHSLARASICRKMDEFIGQTGLGAIIHASAVTYIAFSWRDGFGGCNAWYESHWV